MISKELKRLSRRELVDIIYQLKKNEQEMQERIQSLEKDLQEFQKSALVTDFLQLLRKQIYRLIPVS